MEEENDEVRAEVVIKVGDKERTVNMVLKEIDELYECKEGKIVMLLSHGGQHPTDIFGGLDDELIILKPISGQGHSLAYDMCHFNQYFEEV